MLAAPLTFPTYLRAKIRGHQPMENGLVGEIRTRMIVVAVRHITFLSPRGIVVAAWSSSYILYGTWKERKIWTNGER